MTPIRRAASSTLRPAAFRAQLNSSGSNPSISDRAETILREVYAPVLETGTPFVVTDFATAELVKVAANAFLATKISFINAMAEVCEATGADVTMLSKALSRPRESNGPVPMSDKLRLAFARMVMDEGVATLVQSFG